MIQHHDQHMHVSEITVLRNQIQILTQQLQVLSNCRAADSLTLQSFQKRNVLLMRDLATRDARIKELEEQVRQLLLHLNSTSSEAA